MKKRKILYGLLIMISRVIVGVVVTSRYTQANTKTPDNTSIEYPLREVSVLTCRGIHRNDHNSSCKIPLPRIAGAKYTDNKDNKQIRETYSVMYKDAYTRPRQQDGSHLGVDISTAQGTPLYAIANGIVEFAGTQGGYGNVVKIQFFFQGQEYLAVYGHMDTIEIKKGDTVKKGQRIGTVGNTGVSGGQMGGFHLHFEINVIDPKLQKFVYGLWECPEWEMGKREFEVVEGGQCRSFIDQRTRDPIAFLEQAGAAIVSTTLPPVEAEPVHNDNDRGKVTITYNKPILVGMPAEIRDMVSNNELMINTSLDNINVNENGKLYLSIINNKTQKELTGLLPGEIELVSSDPTIDINPSSISLLFKKTEINIKPKKPGNTTITVMIEGKPWGSINFDVGSTANTTKTISPIRFICLYQPYELMRYFF